MFQKTYILDDSLAPDEMDRIIAADPHYKSCSACLMQVYEPICDPEFISYRMQLQREILPNANIVGMTTLGPVGPETEVPRDPMVTVVYFEESGFDIHLFDCHNIDPREAGKRLCEAIASTEHVEGVLLLTADAMLSPTPFIEELEAQYPDISVFGAQAGTAVLGNDQSMVFTSSEICTRGILAVVFHGENLHITTDYNLGWQPIGREMTITEMGDDGFVKTIDHEIATDVYQKYLDVELDDAFYANVCAFPLLTPSGNRLIARVPTRFSEDGAMQFPAMLAQGSKVTLSYTKPDYLLRNTLASANAMAQFAPQAIMLFACINRRVYMGNERADREFSYYRHFCPDLSFAYGFGEILRTPEGGELLNSTIVAAALREGDVPEGFAAEEYADPELSSDGTTYKPLSDRLVTFLEATTAELNATIDELERLAQRDQLTGIYNRRHVDEIIEQRLSKHRRRNDQGLALLMYDIDHFKQVNDTFGHEMGDIVLKELTRRVQEVVRDDDVIGRWGGEEFLIIANNATLEQAEELAERVRQHVEATPFPHVGKVTISIGVTCAKAADTGSTLFGRVDRALYEAKDSGRNCVKTCF
ncbi:MAG: GGDEF domain-containing protein [Eggerthellaceae bacterium]|nr:GGDEF domain-containing protein [Eggerthellaceae bacterium]